MDEAGSARQAAGLVADVRGRGPRATRQAQPRREADGHDGEDQDGEMRLVVSIQALAPGISCAAMPSSAVAMLTPPMLRP